MKRLKLNTSELANAIQLRNAPKPQHVWSRGATEKGKIITLNSKACTMEGCRGQRVSVRWPDGTLTYPCSAGMLEREDGDWQLTE